MAGVDLREAAELITLDLLSVGLVEADFGVAVEVLPADSVPFGGLSVEGFGAVFGSGRFAVEAAGFSGLALAIGAGLAFGSSVLTGFALAFGSGFLAATFALGNGLVGALAFTGLGAAFLATGFLATGLLAFTGLGAIFFCATFVAALRATDFFGSAFKDFDFAGDAFLTDFVAIWLSAPGRLAAPVRYK
ncbi:MAG TPA: hypothetical protein VG757_10435 [Devosia sp.]|nr:hypothetical protein [Devosia sp.]